MHDAAIRSVDPRDDAAGSSPLDPTRFPPRPARPGRGIPNASRRSLLIAAMAAVTIVAVAVAIAASHGRPGKSAGATTTRPHATVPSTTTTSPASTTTAPLVVASPGSHSDFRVSKPSYTLVVHTANAACWVDVRSPTGTDLFTGTLAAGQSQSVTAGAMTVRLGNPAAASITIDGLAVPIDLATGSPVTLHFQGTA